MTNPQTTILETKRLILRRLIMDDLEDLFTLYSDPEVRKYFPEGTLNYEETKEELEWFLNGHPAYPELGLWATIHKETGQFVGRCGLLPWTIEGRDEVEVAYMIARNHWRRGLGSEAAQGILQYGFEKLNLSRLICLIDKDNQASIKVATGMSMTFEKEVDDGMGPAQLYSIYKLTV
ncbi:MAG: GNAT family N-acetyltransferase [Anaerolineae bacterium]|nr:GNAT family N-acetyltransferase [Anaerolineae bacterium]MCI0607963.1 GNAT family N-acetyltransferase [Anaerolineae bacterium]